MGDSLIRYTFILITQEILVINSIEILILSIIPKPELYIHVFVQNTKSKTSNSLDQYLIGITGCEKYFK